MWSKKFIEFVDHTPEGALEKSARWISENACQEVSITRVNCEVVETKWNATVYYERLIK